MKSERTFPHAISNRCVVDINKIILISSFCMKIFLFGLWNIVGQEPYTCKKMLQTIHEYI